MDRKKQLVFKYFDTIFETIKKHIVLIDKDIVNLNDFEEIIKNKNIDNGYKLLYMLINKLE